MERRNELALCAGIGGFSLGLRIAEPLARTVCYVEREAFCCEVLASQIEAGQLDPAPIWTDLRTFDGRPWRGVVDLVTAGIPCQPWSLAGKRREQADERHLGDELVRIVREVEPSLVLVENVPGFVRRGLPGLLSQLAELGFDAEWGLFSAAEVGAPHLRKRLFVLGTHPDRSRLAERQGERCNARKELQAVVGSNWWKSEPDVGRVAHGVSDRVDRLRGLGNAVVPLVVAHAFRTLLKRVRDRKAGNPAP